jgi:hypothetical protein
MVLRLKPRESRSLPVLLRTSDKASSRDTPRQHISKSPAVARRRGFLFWLPALTECVPGGHRVLWCPAAAFEPPMPDYAKIMDDVVQTTLSPLSFRRTRPNTWVEETPGPIRRIFGLMALKGATHTVYWGFSLDFVPLAHGRHLRWKRTPKSAHVDLCIRSGEVLRGAGLQPQRSFAAQGGSLGARHCRGCPRRVSPGSIRPALKAP